MKKGKVLFFSLVGLALVACTTKPTTTLSSNTQDSTTSKPDVTTTEPTSTETSSEPTSTETTTETTTTTTVVDKTWSAEIVEMMKNNLGGYVVPYFEVEGTWTELYGSVSFELPSYVEKDVTTVKNVLMENHYDDVTADFGEEAGPNDWYLVHHFGEKNEKVVLAYTFIYSTRAEICFEYQEYETVWDEAVINDEIFNVFGDVTLPKLTADFDYLEYFDNSDSINEFVVNVYGADVTAAYKTTLLANEWQEVEGKIINSSKTAEIKLTYDADKNMTHMSIVEYVETFANWPAETVQNLLTQHGYPVSVPAVEGADAYAMDLSDPDWYIGVVCYSSDCAAFTEKVYEAYTGLEGWTIDKEQAVIEHTSGAYVEIYDYSDEANPFIEILINKE